jgi:hypothetical protein
MAMPPNLQAFYHFRSQDRSAPTVIKAGGPVMFTDRTSPVARWLVQKMEDGCRNRSHHQNT